MANHEEVELGDLVKDEITGFEGIAVSVTMWLNGCRRIGLQPRTITKDGDVGRVEVFDEIQLSVVEKGVFKGTNTIKPRKEKKERTGGPLRDEARLLTRTRNKE